MGSILYQKIAMTAKILSQTSNTILRLKDSKIKCIITTKVTPSSLGESVTFTLHLLEDNTTTVHSYSVILQYRYLTVNNDAYLDTELSKITEQIIQTIYAI